MTRTAVLVMSSVMVFACVEAPSLQPAEDPVAPLNQFHARSQQALTLADGGQCPISVNADAELMIRNLLVVEDPVRTNWSGSLTNGSDGAWAFGRLMTAMAGQNDPEVFVRNWLAQWDSPQTVNGLPVAPRPMNALVTQPWLNASGGTRLDLRRAPFRLLAIVNRMDLRDLTRGSAGEGRFVFGVLDAGGNPLQFTVILEFNLPATTQADVDRWAADWHALGAQPIGSPGYNQALETITSRFAGASVSPTRPNGSAINHVRSNEIALAAPWELREFRLNAAGQLIQAPVAQTTALQLNDSPALAQFINANTAALLTDTHVVPESFNGAPFLAGSALTNFGHTWRAPGITNNEARFHFSVNTCNGCHAGETNTAFLHVSPRNVGQVAVLSGYLTGTTVPDPVTGQPRTFNDLATRTESLLAVLCREPSTTAAVAVTAPTAGSTVRGPTTLSATATGVLTVQFLVDGLPVSPPLTPPFNAPWSADFVPFGPHTVTAVGQTSTGTVSSAPVSFVTAPFFGPDFRVTISSAPTLVRPGEPFITQLNVCNIGNQPGSTSVELFSSADAVISGPRSANPDLILGGAPVSLSTGECRLVSVSGSASQPPGATSPSVFLGAIVDSQSGVAELDETNNTSPASPLLIGVGPDFTISSVSAPAAILPGASFTTTVTVCNRGNQAGGTELDLLSSTDTTIAVPPDFFAGSAPRVNLSAGECRAVPVQTFALPPGTSFLGAIAVRGDFELVSTNNTSPARRIDVGTMAELTVTGVTAPGSALPGARFSTSATLCNNGTVAATTSGALVLAASRTFVLPSPSALQVGGFTVTIPASTCISQAVSGTAVPLPGVTSAFVAVVLDQSNSVPEFIETNNQLASTTTMGIGFMPDFRVSSVTAPNALTPGSPFTANATVCNVGTVAGSTEVELRLSTTPVGMAPVTLNPNQCLSVAIPGVAHPPGGPGAGTLSSLTATADPRGVIPEFSEDNNVSPPFTMAIGFGPDFVVTSVSVPTALAPGQSFTATVTACNRGTAPGSMQVDLLFSTDSVLSLGSDVRAPGGAFTLSAGQCLSRSVPSFMPASAPAPTPGTLSTTFFIGGVADPNDSVLELNETNNTSPARSFQLGFGPDFVITALSVPASAVLGATISARVTVCNRGTTAGPVDVVLIASTDNIFSTKPPIAVSDLLLPGQGTFSLAPNACETRTLGVPALSPTGQVGTVFLAAVADFNQSQNELSETNNLSPIRSLRLAAPAP
jgi:hypothetical protein